MRWRSVNASKATCSRLPEIDKLALLVRERRRGERSTRTMESLVADSARFDVFHLVVPRSRQSAAGLADAGRPARAGQAVPALSMVVRNCRPWPPGAGAQFRQVQGVAGLGVKQAVYKRALGKHARALAAVSGRAGRVDRIARAVPSARNPPMPGCSWSGCCWRWPTRARAGCWPRERAQAAGLLRRHVRSGASRPPRRGARPAMRWMPRSRWSRRPAAQGPDPRRCRNAQRCWTWRLPGSRPVGEPARAAARAGTVVQIDTLGGVPGCAGIRGSGVGRPGYARGSGPTSPSGADRDPGNILAVPLPSS
jgi:hypothetical protein